MSKRVQAKPAAERAAPQPNAGLLQRTSTLGPHACVQPNRTPEGDTSAMVEGVISSPGRPLDAAARAYMEPRFGRDFSHVRIHTDHEAAQSARAVDADAYAVGNHVAFGAGQYAPGMAAGRRTLAHELTHVVQSGSSAAPAFARQPLVIGDPADQAEAAADRVGEAVAADRAPTGTGVLATKADGDQALVRRQPAGKKPGQRLTPQEKKKQEQERARAAAEAEKEAAAWDLVRLHFRPELLIKFQEIGRAAAKDARQYIDNLFAPYEKEISTPDQTFLSIFLAGAGNVPQGEFGGFLGGAAAQGFQAAIGAVLNTGSVAEVKGRARSIPDDLIAERLTSDSPAYTQFESGAMQDLYHDFSDWWDSHPQFHDDPGQIRVEAALLEEQARRDYGANSPRGQAVRAALLKTMQRGFRKIREELEDLQDEYRRKHEVGVATGVATGIGLLAGGIIGASVGGFAGAAIGGLIGGLGLGGLLFGLVKIKQAFTPTAKELRERQKKPAAPEEEKEEATNAA